MADNASESSGISVNPMSSSGQVQPVFTMTGTGGSGLQIVSEKLSETNYASWAVAVELYVEGHDKLDILHGTKVKPDEKDPSFRTWRRDNIQLMTWMLNSVNSGIKQVILHNKTTYDMWKTLEQMYGRRHDMLRTYQISSQIFKLEQGSMSVTNYFATLKGLWDEFDYYRMENWSSTDDLQRYLKLLEKDRIIKFLDGLTAEFENLKGQILGLDPTPSLEQVYYKILSEEGRKRTMNNKGISAVGPPIGKTSVFIGSANKFRPGGTKRQGDRFCRHCKRTNHDSDFCWEKYPEKKPEKFKHNAKKAPNSSNIAVQKIENKEPIGSSVPSTTGLSSTDIAHTGIRGLGLSVIGPSFYSPWVIDSGATDHMTNAANSFISYSLSSGQEKVIIADGTKATVAGKGSIKLTDHFFLSSALHVPSVSINLLSVSSITKQLHCSVTFFPDHCVFQDLETKQTIGTGRKGENITSSFVPQVVPQVISSPIPLDVIENRKDAPPLGKDAPSLGAQSSPDIITYKRQRRKQEPTIDRLVESDALAPDPVKQLSSSVESTAPLNMNELNLPVAVRKGVRSCTQHPISNYVSYSRLSPSYHAFVSQLSNHAIPSPYYEETGKLGSRPASTPIEVNHDLTSSSGEDLTSLEKGTYQRLVGKLLYLSMTRPDITYAVSVVSQYMHAPKTIHMKAIDRILSQLVLSKIGSEVGKPLYTDNLTRTRERLEYARLMVEIPAIGERVHEVPITLPTGVQVDLKIIYEMVPDFCQTCNKLGHQSENCRGNATPVGQQRNNPRTDPNGQGHGRPRSQSARGRGRTRSRYGNRPRQQWRPTQQVPNVEVPVDQQELAIVVVNDPIPVDVILPNCENETQQGEDQIPQQQPPQEEETIEEVPKETGQGRPPEGVQQPAISSEGSTSSSSTSSSTASHEDRAASETIHTVSVVSTSSSLPTTTSSTSGGTASSASVPTIGTRQRHGGVQHLLQQKGIQVMALMETKLKEEALSSILQRRFSGMGLLAIWWRVFELMKLAVLEGIGGG
ncbi:hypothetical protein ZIOFF_033555 [Zingiber officinale]|uniref:Retrovirus-related Pol polyprotein from transposon TNT 1-94-like beta-barrel domain-containing protein n=1 Tax=Zingiber officinale TaxID=94328 RepID=A0A8J5GJS8_ZINOF|nr:hypothetical protein ZIOFF_033555 [Zingiber officinale]